MPRKTISIAAAKASFSKQVRAVEQGEPLVITRHGKPVVALIRLEDLELLERLRACEPPPLVPRAAGPAGGLASLAGGWEGSDELADAIQASGRVGRK